MNASTTAPTGEQFVITLGDARAVITELAASLREYTVGGVHVTASYPEDSTPPSACGIVLVPWPNRVEDGRWSLDGQPQQLDITEVDKHNAIHGLLRNTGYRLLERAGHAVTLGAHIHPQHGYPFHLETSVRYELLETGLSVTHHVRNLSQATAPVAIGTHPFLTIGDVDPGELELTVHASTKFDVDERLNPIAETPVDAATDLRAGRRVSELELDTAYGTLVTQHGVSAVLRAPDGREVRLVQDDDLPYVQVYTSRSFPGQSIAIALEPMTAPPNAFNSGLGLRWVQAGDSWTVGWGIQHSL